jgi:hypothetical protein
MMAVVGAGASADLGVCHNSLPGVSIDLPHGADAVPGAGQVSIDLDAGIVVIGPGQRASGADSGGADSSGYHMYQAHRKHAVMPAEPRIERDIDDPGPDGGTI